MPLNNVLWFHQDKTQNDGNAEKKHIHTRTHNTQHTCPYPSQKKKKKTKKKTNIKIHECLRSDNAMMAHTKYGIKVILQNLSITIRNVVVIYLADDAVQYGT